MYRVKVYRNLRNGMFSVVNTKTGRLMYHTSDITLEDAVFRVQPSGLQRARRNRQRNVHAYVQGRVSTATVKPTGGQLVYYNPFSQDTFTCNGKPVYEAALVRLVDNKCYILYS